MVGFSSVELLCMLEEMRVEKGQNRLSQVHFAVICSNFFLQSEDTCNQDSVAKKRSKKVCAHMWVIRVGQNLRTPGVKHYILV